MNVCVNCTSKCCCSFSSCYKCLSKYFKLPFSFCTFVSFFLCIIPAIVGIIVWGVNLNTAINYCNKGVQTVAIVMSIFHIYNFIFCAYLVCKFSSKVTNYEQSKATHCVGSKFCTKLCY